MPVWRELTNGGEFAVASMEYRWAGQADGDAVGNTTQGWAG